MRLAPQDAEQRDANRCCKQGQLCLLVVPFATVLNRTDHVIA